MCVDRYVELKMSKMEKMENMLRRFHLMKEPRESEARQQLKRELFAFNKVPYFTVVLLHWLVNFVVIKFVNIREFFTKRIIRHEGTGGLERPPG